MSTIRRPRKGSLQFWPRKRARKFLPRVNWSSVSDSNKTNLKGFICYKVGMGSAYVRDETPNSMMKGKKIIVPVTILECPPMKILSVRFYRGGIVKNEFLADSVDKELNSKIKISKVKHHDKLDKINLSEYDDLRIMVYSNVKKSGLKKTPDISELGLSGSLDEKLKFAKENLGKEISISSVFDKKQLIDSHGLTKGHGFSGPVKRFGITLKSHKSEKGRRRPGSLGPWHPARVTYMAPMAGQLGMFARPSYNHNIVDLGKADGKFNNIKNYGNINTDYLVVHGSLQGPAKRQLLITASARETKKQKKKHFEFIELR